MSINKVAVFLVIFAALFLGVSVSQEAKTGQAKQDVKTQSTATSEKSMQKEEVQKENVVVIKGEVKEIAKDKTYIVVEGTKILTTKEFLDESYLEVGDKVEITAENTKDGLKAVSFNYIFEEEETGSGGEGFETEEVGKE